MYDCDLNKGLVEDERPREIPSNWHPGRISQEYSPTEIERELKKLDSKRGLLTRALSKARRGTESLE